VTTTSRTPAGTVTRTLRPAQALAALTVLSEFFQFITAGQLFPSGGPERVHAGGAIVLHLVSGLAAVAVFLHHRASGGAWWPTVLAVVVFGLTLVQAATGGRDHLAVHVPGAMIVTVGSVWLATWLFTRVPRRV
jgi:uncharacterized membrane protein YhhN